jgi:hypothetical protein
MPPLSVLALGFLTLLAMGVILIGVAVTSHEPRLFRIWCLFVALAFISVPLHLVCYPLRWVIHVLDWTLWILEYPFQKSYLLGRFMRYKASRSK